MPKPIPEAPVPVEVNPFKALMGLFDRVSLSERIERIRHGLRQPKDSGEYKWARVELLRLFAPVVGVIVPLLAVFLVILLPSARSEARTYEVTMLDVQPPPPMEPPKPLEPPPDFTPPDVQIDDPTMETPSLAPSTPFSPKPQTFNSVAISKSPVTLEGVYSSRNPGSIGSLAGWGGGGDWTEGAVLAALRWMKKNQSEDGSWPQDKAAMTGLCLLAYLAHNETPASEEFGLTVRYAIEFLMRDYVKEGRYFRSRDSNDYTHPIAAYALAEAYAMTLIPEVKETAENAMLRIVQGQNKWGGFNYKLVGPTDERNDTTYSSWCVQALKAAKMSGLYVEGLDQCMAKAVAGIQRNYGGDSYAGGFGYIEKGQVGSPLTGAGVLSLQFLGAHKTMECTGGIAGLDGAPFSWESPAGASPLYYWYYITQAKFQFDGPKGPTWVKWNKMFARPLVKNQMLIPKEQSGYVDHNNKPQAIGSWLSPSASEHSGAAANKPVMHTALCTLMLEVYYRYLPTYKTAEPEKAPEIKTDKGNVKALIDWGANG